MMVDRREFMKVCTEWVWEQRSFLECCGRKRKASRNHQR